MQETKVTAFDDERAVARAAGSSRRGPGAFDGQVLPADASQHFLRKLGRLRHEEVHALWLDVRQHSLGSEMLFRGGLDGVQVVVRTVAQFALARNAAAVVFAHNHPSGDARPTRSDVSLTRRLAVALELFDVDVLDHFVVGTEVISMRKGGYWSPEHPAMSRS